MNRTPPAAVRRQLRAEVGFGCPVTGCGNPYLGYHHFDPPWSERPHHDPGGMVALCGEHHPKADAGAFTLDQLRDLKIRKAEVVEGSFDWRRDELLAVVGGNLYFETPKMVVFRGDPLIWFDRDDEGFLRLSLKMLSRSFESRLELDANDWRLLGAPSDFESPPSGRRIAVSYPNGDRLRVEFLSLKSKRKAAKRYPIFGRDTWAQLPFPLTAVELQMFVGGTRIAFGPTSTQLGGVQMTGCLTMRCGAGLSFD